MSDLIEKNVTDLLNRVQNLETKNNKDQDNEDVLAGLDRISAYNVTTMNALINLLMEKKTITTEELEISIGKEHKRLNDAMSTKHMESEDKSPLEPIIEDKKE